MIGQKHNVDHAFNSQHGAQQRALQYGRMTQQQFRSNDNSQINASPSNQISLTVEQAQNLQEMNRMDATLHNKRVTQVSTRESEWRPDTQNIKPMNL